jgi:hypothetical protein
MPPDPSLTSVGALVTIVQKLCGTYQAYKSGKIKETDDGLREDIRRRIKMIELHIGNIENQSLEASNVKVIRQCAIFRDAISRFTHDVNMGISGSSGSVHTQAEIIGTKQIRQLIEHDRFILEKLVEVTRLVNEVENYFPSGDGDIISLLMEGTQKLTSTINRYSERQTLLGGFKR